MIVANFIFRPTNHLLDTRGLSHNWAVARRYLQPRCLGPRLSLSLGLVLDLVAALALATEAGVEGETSLALALVTEGGSGPGKSQQYQHHRQPRRLPRCACLLQPSHSLTAQLAGYGCSSRVY